MYLTNSGFFKLGVGSVKTGKSLAGIIGVVDESSVIMRITYLKASLYEPEYTEHFVLDQAAIGLHDYYLKDAEDVIVDFKKVKTFLQRYFEHQKNGLRIFKPEQKSEDSLNKIHEYFNDDGSNVLFTTEIVIPKNDIVAFLDKETIMPVPLMKRIRRTCINQYGPHGMPAISEENMKKAMTYFAILNAKCNPPEPGQPKTYRFRKNGNVVDSDDFLKGLEEVVSL